MKWASFMSIRPLIRPKVSAVLPDLTWDCRAGNHRGATVFPFGADAIDGFLSDEASLSLHSSDRLPSSARFLLCKQPTKTQPGTVVISTASPLHFLLSTHVFLFLIVHNSEHPGVMAFGSKMEAHERPHMFFCFLSPLLRWNNSMLLLLPHRWMIGCDDIYTTGRLFFFLALLMILH
ncbi:hypothetical protein FOTG_02996 [Fusarium oxysporum f. sp. vasinfectum 25433]|uniref:Uncharacterized protein n=1 Tax=Fusarium oxysporum f. sp. vasinfectum 25433 TaxID=1089449 RepID=X0MGV3_FUSOX|nr:hypothetical protein FOTG_02996 [Fusarium oxysporum f. sp. vasinfectum 25433]